MLDTCGGFLVTGGRPNVHPEEYGEAGTKAHGDCDRARDAITLPLIRRCVERGQPFFGVCRGFQEVNVAMGGTLHPEIRELPGRDNHRMPPDGTLEEIRADYRKRSKGKAKLDDFTDYSIEPGKLDLMISPPKMGFIEVFAVDEKSESKKGFVSFYSCSNMDDLFKKYPKKVIGIIIEN